MSRAYIDSLTKGLFTDEDLCRDDCLDVVKSTGYGGGIICHKEIRIRISCAILQPVCRGIIIKIIGNRDHGNALGLGVGSEGLKI